MARTLIFRLILPLILLSVLHLSSLLLFTKGFLLSRLTLVNRSDFEPISSSPPDGGSASSLKTHSKLLWIVIDALREDFLFPPSTYSSSSSPSNPYSTSPSPYLHLPSDLTSRDPSHSRIFRFVADPPTTTLQRIKGMTTGTLPTFIDAGENFVGGNDDDSSRLGEGSEGVVGEDNLLELVRRNGGKVGLVGDETWVGAFGGGAVSLSSDGSDADSGSGGTNGNWTFGKDGIFSKSITFPFDSFNVQDLDTVDEGVFHHSKHLIPPLSSSSSSSDPNWSFLIFHFLGLDHVFHSLGPSHPTTSQKISQYDSFLADLIENRLDDDTLLVVCGDHGMDGKGDHGGESEGEVNAGIWVYSKGKEIADGNASGEIPFDDPKNPLYEFFNDDGTKEEDKKIQLDAGDKPLVDHRPLGGQLIRSIRQIDLVPSLSLLLGLPIPFNNLGSPIPDLFYRSTMSEKNKEKNVLTAVRKGATQVWKYLTASRGQGHRDLEAFWSELGTLWGDAELTYHANKNSPTGGKLIETARMYQDFMRTTLIRSRSVWAQFDWSLMTIGVTLLLGSLLVSFRLYKSPTKVGMNYKNQLRAGGVGLTIAVGFWIAGVGAGHRAGRNVWSLAGLAGGIEGWLLATNSGLGLKTDESKKPTSSSLFRALPSFDLLIGFGIPIVHSALFASNSFTIHEDRSLLFLFQAALLLLSLNSFFFSPKSSNQRQSPDADPVKLKYRLLVFGGMALVAVRGVATLRVCREEQTPRCLTTFYGTASTSTFVALADAPTSGSSGGTSLPPLWTLPTIVGLSYFLPGVITTFLRLSNSNKGPANFFLDNLLRWILLAGNSYWIIDFLLAQPSLPDQINPETGEVETWKDFVPVNNKRLAKARDWLAKGAMLGVVVSLVLWLVSGLCIEVLKKKNEEQERKEQEHNQKLKGSYDTTQPPSSSAQRSGPGEIRILGFANSFGSIYLLFSIVILFGLLSLVNQPSGQVAIGVGLIALMALLDWGDTRKDLQPVAPEHHNLPSETPKVLPVPTSHTSLLACLSYLLYFATGHQATLSSLQWKTAFVGFPKLTYPVSPILVILNTLGPFVLVSVFVPLLVLWNLTPILNTTPPSRSQTSLPSFPLSPPLLRALLSFISYHTLTTLSTMLFAAHFRRHLMVWKIFAPRFMLGGVTLLAIDFGVIVLGVGIGLWGTVRKVELTFRSKVE